MVRHRALNSTCGGSTPPRPVSVEEFFRGKVPPQGLTIGGSLNHRPVAIFAGRSNPKFAHTICEDLGIEIGRSEIVQFSDGEVFVEIGDNVRGRDVFIVQSTCRPGNDHLMELLIFVDALKRASAWRITAVMPYFGYARQDRKVKPRVPITAKLVADLIQTPGTNRVLTLDLHAGQIMGFFNVPVDNLNSLPVMLPYLKENYGGEELTIVSPDVGGVERARNFATHLDNANLAIIDKRRPGPNQIAEMNVVGEVKGTTCIIVDDMVDTAGTLCKAAETLIKAGAKKVVACAPHALLSGNARERIETSALQEVIVSDSVPLNSASRSDKIKVISVAHLFAEAIKRIYSNDSVSSLFS